ncbi:MAG TPA: hypothetical protein VF658_13260 [Pyrinomonadaceae bacterium]|jgi:hypothetical protein
MLRQNPHRRFLRQHSAYLCSHHHLPKTIQEAAGIASSLFSFENPTAVFILKYQQDTVIQPAQARPAAAVAGL